MRLILDCALAAASAASVIVGLWVLGLIGFLVSLASILEHERRKR